MKGNALAIIFSALLACQLAFASVPSVCPTCASPSYMDISVTTGNPTTESQSDILIYNITGNYEKVPIKGGLIYRVDIANPNSVTACYKATGANGIATFYYPGVFDGCIDYRFIFCPDNRALLDTPEGKELRHMCLDSTGLPQSIIDSNEIEECAITPGAPSNEALDNSLMLPSHNELYLCNKVPGNYQGLCWPLIAIFALLIGASFAVGRNPFMAFDLSSPRLSRGKQYTMRAQQMSFDAMSYLMAADKAVGAVGKASDASKKSKARKEGDKDGDGKLSKQEKKDADASIKGSKLSGGLFNLAGGAISSALGGGKFAEGLKSVRDVGKTNQSAIKLDFKRLLKSGTADDVRAKVKELQNPDTQKKVEEKVNTILGNKKGTETLSGKQRRQVMRALRPALRQERRATMKEARAEVRTARKEMRAKIKAARHGEPVEKLTNVTYDVSGITQRIDASGVGAGQSGLVNFEGNTYKVTKGESGSISKVERVDSVVGANRQERRGIIHDIKGTARAFQSTVGAALSGRMAERAQTISLNAGKSIEFSGKPGENVLENTTNAFKAAGISGVSDTDLVKIQDMQNGDTLNVSAVVNGKAQAFTITRSDDTFQVSKAAVEHKRTAVGQFLHWYAYGKDEKASFIGDTDEKKLRGTIKSLQAAGITISDTDLAKILDQKTDGKIKVTGIDANGNEHKYTFVKEGNSYHLFKGRGKHSQGSGGGQMGKADAASPSQRQFMAINQGSSMFASIFSAPSILDIFMIPRYFKDWQWKSDNVEFSSIWAMIKDKFRLDFSSISDTIQTILRIYLLAMAMMAYMRNMGAFAKGLSMSGSANVRGVGGALGGASDRFNRMDGIRHIAALHENRAVTIKMPKVRGLGIGGSLGGSISYDIGKVSEWVANPNMMPFGMNIFIAPILGSLTGKISSSMQNRTEDVAVGRKATDKDGANYYVIDKGSGNYLVFKEGKKGNLFAFGKGKEEDKAKEMITKAMQTGETAYLSTNIFNTSASVLGQPAFRRAAARVEKWKMEELQNTQLLLQKMQPSALSRLLSDKEKEIYVELEKMKDRQQFQDIIAKIDYGGAGSLSDDEQQLIGKFLLDSNMVTKAALEKGGLESLLYDNPELLNSIKRANIAYNSSEGNLRSAYSVYKQLADTLQWQIEELGQMQKGSDKSREAAFSAYSLYSYTEWQGKSSLELLSLNLSASPMTMATRYAAMDKAGREKAMAELEGELARLKDAKLRTAPKDRQESLQLALYLYQSIDNTHQFDLSKFIKHQEESVYSKPLFSMGDLGSVLGNSAAMSMFSKESILSARTAFETQPGMVEMEISGKDNKKYLVRKENGQIGIFGFSSSERDKKLAGIEENRHNYTNATQLAYASLAFGQLESFNTLYATASIAHTASVNGWADANSKEMSNIISTVISNVSDGNADNVNRLVNCLRGTEGIVALDIGALARRKGLDSGAVENMQKSFGIILNKINGNDLERAEVAAKLMESEMGFLYATVARSVNQSHGYDLAVRGINSIGSGSLDITAAVVPVNVGQGKGPVDVDFGKYLQGGYSGEENGELIERGLKIAVELKCMESMKNFIESQINAGNYAGSAYSSEMNKLRKLIADDIATYQSLYERYVLGTKAEKESIERDLNTIYALMKTSSDNYEKNEMRAYRTSDAAIDVQIFGKSSEWIGGYTYLSDPGGEALQRVRGRGTSYTLAMRSIFGTSYGGMSESAMDAGQLRQMPTAKLKETYSMTFGIGTGALESALKLEEKDVRSAVLETLSILNGWAADPYIGEEALKNLKAAADMCVKLAKDGTFDSKNYGQIAEIVQNSSEAGLVMKGSGSEYRRQSTEQSEELLKELIKANPWQYVEKQAPMAQSHLMPEERSEPSQSRIDDILGNLGKVLAPGQPKAAPKEQAPAEPQAEGRAENEPEPSDEMMKRAAPKAHRKRPPREVNEETEG